MKNNNKTPLITIVTTTFNAAKQGRLEFFKQCIESVHNQTYKNIEHIVQDAGSADGTLDFLKEYESKGWIKLYSEKDKGIDDGYNNGCKKANGDYIAILNDDEYYYDNNIVENVVNYLLKDDYDYCYGDAMIIKDEKNKRCWCGINFLQDFWWNMSANHSTFFIKNEVYKKLNYYSLDYETVGDYDFVIRLVLEDFKSVYIPKLFINYRLGGISNNKNNKEMIEKVKDNIGLVLKNRLYSKFYIGFDNIKASNIFGCNVRCIPPLFLEKFTYYLESLELKNFNYIKFNNYINNIDCKRYYTISNSCPHFAIKLFNFIPILKVKTNAKGNKVYYKLFGFIPLFVKRIKSFI
ncbi:MAG: glycosyltransferase [Rickettsiales bacterium]|jgi:glycosyltransferase involved in cell wall biosynthesis|nr:glycosyltransferase [Rickettsiales bacterium]